MLFFYLHFEYAGFVLNQHSHKCCIIIWLHVNCLHKMWPIFVWQCAGIFSVSSMISMVLSIFMIELNLKITSNPVRSTSFSYGDIINCVTHNIVKLGI